MHIHTLDQWQHSHNFAVDYQAAEKITKLVLLLTAITMVAEIIAGSLFGSMALLADGWHMATHVAAFGITVFAYHYARSHANNPRYTFGTGKVTVLGGFTSAIALAVIALVMALESVGRWFQPHQIQFNEAIWVAVLGLAVNLLSAVLLNGHSHHGHGHDHGHSHSHDDHEYEYHHEYDSHSHEYHSDDSHTHDYHGDHRRQTQGAIADHHSGIHQDTHDGRVSTLANNTAPQAHRDHNLQAAYMHVLADALTSVLAIAALVAGKLWGWVWMDAAMGVVGAVVIARWAYGLVKETGVILLDGTTDKQIKLAIAHAIEQGGDERITDLHVWNLSQDHLAATIALVTHHPQPPEHYRQRLSHIESLAHVLVEVNLCHDLTNHGSEVSCSHAWDMTSPVS